MKPEVIFQEVKLLLYRLGADTRCASVVLQSLKPFIVRTTARTFRLNPKDQVDGMALGRTFHEVTGNQISVTEKIPVHKVRQRIRSLHGKDMKVTSLFTASRSKVEKLLRETDVEETCATFHKLFGDELETVIQRAMEDDGQHGADVGHQCAKMCTASIELGLLSALASHTEETRACANLITYQQSALLYGIRKGTKNVLYAVTG